MTSLFNIWTKPKQSEHPGMSILRMRKIGGRAFARLLMFSFVVWSILPSVVHAPTVLETIADHQKMIAEHGHSHGFEEDLLWAMHGHSHDAMDHDHSPVLLAQVQASTPAENRDIWKPGVSKNKTSLTFLIERPPRV